MLISVAWLRSQIGKIRGAIAELSENSFSYWMEVLRSSLSSCVNRSLAERLDIPAIAPIE